MRKPSEVLLWITPKIFDDLCRPAAAVGAFLEHYRGWLDGRPATVVVAAGNGDHVLNYAGPGGRLDRFDWARYSGYASSPEPDRVRRGHNLEWLRHVREGGERSGEPYATGPMMILSEQVMDYEVLSGIYATVRAEAEKRGIDLRLLEYLAAGADHCAAEWKTRRHPEAFDDGLEVSAPLAPDSRRYAAFPEGIGPDLAAGDFVAAQTAAFCADFGLDGVLLGGRFGREGARFFRALRERMGPRFLYRQDERGTGAAGRESLDAVLVSASAALDERGDDAHDLPRVIMGLDFVDPWHWSRAYLDDRPSYVRQREVLSGYSGLIDGVSFYANDTFGHFVPPAPLGETLVALGEAEGRGGPLHQEA